MDVRHDSNRTLAFAAGMVVLVALFICVRPPLTSSVAQRIGVGQQMVPVGPGQEVTQTFKAVSNHVDGVGLMVAKGAARDGEITVSLAPTGEAAAKASVTRRVADIGDWELVQFPFGGVATRAGEEYAIRVTATSQLYLAAPARDRYLHGEAASLGQPLPNDLVFRIYRRADLRDLTRRGVGLPLGVAALLMLMAAGCSGWVISRMLQV